ncbi:LysR family transcriptional regulator [Vibrio sp. JC009]|uniref:LysR substrate-binding domain-containing protein n=1 Tax=Vibrio sp. JC009 TaxID=2912314 RepID=UPI0023B06748|nr:LysR substrate-binding domain-containing protein [Vibrio sp. JC009]WED24661.1 LysR family transcriptional regulator [Vibrio sp. JC009]
MSEVNWKGVDLNLLLTFDAIIRFESVSEASKHLHLGQPATSYNLKRLRELIQDPLFERHGHRMLPTTRAREIAPKVAEILHIVTSDILPLDKFNALEFDGIFRIGLSDYAEQIYAPLLFDSLSHLAPKSKVIFKPADSAEHCVGLLENDEVDLCVGVFHSLPDHVFRNFLYQEKHLCMFDNSKVHASSPISLQEYLDTPQAIITANQELVSQVDVTLKKMQTKRNVVIGTTRYLTIRQMLKERTLLAVMAEMVGKVVVDDDGLTMCEPPIDIPDFNVDLIGLKRDINHPRLAWLMELMQDLIQKKVAEIRA